MPLSPSVEEGPVFGASVWSTDCSHFQHQLCHPRDLPMRARPVGSRLRGRSARWAPYPGTGVLAAPGQWALSPGTGVLAAPGRWARSPTGMMIRAFGECARQGRCPEGDKASLQSRMGSKLDSHKEGTMETNTERLSFCVNKDVHLLTSGQPGWQRFFPLAIKKMISLSNEELGGNLCSSDRHTGRGLGVLPEP